MKFINAFILKIRQKLVNREYKKNGLTNKVLDKQIAINKKRRELDISDSSKKIYKNFVQ